MSARRPPASSSRDEAAELDDLAFLLNKGAKASKRTEVCIAQFSAFFSVSNSQALMTLGLLSFVSLAC